MKITQQKCVNVIIIIPTIVTYPVETPTHTTLQFQLVS